MTYRYDTRRHRAYFSYNGKQSFVDVPRSQGIHVAFRCLASQIRTARAA